MFLFPPKSAPAGVSVTAAAVTSLSEKAQGGRRKNASKKQCGKPQTTRSAALQYLDQIAKPQVRLLMPVAAPAAAFSWRGELLYSLAVCMQVLNFVASMVDNGVDVSIAPNSSVILEPADSLSFRLEPQTAPQAVLTIRNVSDDRKIAFKVKTTRPMRYLVRPNQGMLGPNGTSSVMVILQQKDCEELLRLDPSERQLSNDKFLVQSIYVDDSFYELVKTKSTKEMADELTNMWAHTDKRSLSNKKLRCRFVQDEEGSMDAGAPSSIAPALARYPSKGSFYTSSNNVLAQEVPLAGSSSSSPSNDEKIATPAQLTSALLQETRPQDAAVHHVRETVAPNSASKVRDQL